MIPEILVNGPDTFIELCFDIKNVDVFNPNINLIKPAFSFFSILLNFCKPEKINEHLVR